MREAAGRRQHLELEYVEALGTLRTKQQEIRELQKAQVEVKREHEGAVQLLEAKVWELERQCQAQSEQFHQLSHELQSFRQSAGNIDLLNKPIPPWASPDPGSKPPTQLKNGVSNPLPKGNEFPSGHQSVICEYIRPFPMSGVKPELLPGCPAGSVGQDQLPEQMDVEPDGGNPKMKYTGRVRLCIARYSYNPYKGPNEHPEAELPLVAGKYLYVYGDMDEDGFYEGELMDGRRGLVPSNFVALLQDEDLLTHPADIELDSNLPNSDMNHVDLHLHSDPAPPNVKADGSLLNQPPVQMYNNSPGVLDVSIDEIGEDIVPYPRKISLIKQLGRTVIVGWEPASVPSSWGTVLSYNVLVDKEVRTNIPAGGRTKALIEKLNLANFTYRISVQSVTDRGTSDELRCTLLVGKDVCVAPSHLRVDNISQTTAEVSWQPSNSNYSHTIFLNGEEFDVVGAASYKYQFFNLRPCMTCTVKAVAEPHQVPWQLPLEQRQHREGTVEFCTLPTGPPAPPQDVTVQVGMTPGTLQINWKPPPLTSTGTSNGARVTGYSVCAKGQKVAEVKMATAESVIVDYLRIQNLETREIIVRTVSAQGESEDSCAAAIPAELLGSCLPRAPARPQPPPSAKVPDTKEQPLGPVPQSDGPWEPVPTPPQLHRSSLEPTVPGYANRSGSARSPSPQRILPQPQGAPISNSMAKAMAREAAERITESNKAEKRSAFSQRSNTFQQENSDEEEEEDYDAHSIKRPGASVDEFLRRSELGRQHYGHADSYHSESSRGSDLSDIMEEDEEELYSEMLLDEGGRRRHSATSHTALKMLGNSSGSCRLSDRMDHAGRRASHGGTGQRARPMTVPSIEITVDSNSEGGRSRSGSESAISPSREDAYYRHVTGRRKWPHQRSTAPESRYNRYSGRELYDDAEPTLCGAETRVFVALFDYDPLSMSPNPDAAEEELPFREGQIIQVHGSKDADGFYHGEIDGRVGLIPCNMVSEIQADSEEMVEQLVTQGFLPLNTPVEKIERDRRSSRPFPVTSRRMVALYDYDPRESSPNVDVEAELTFCAGDIISVWGELDEDGFYYGEINGQKGLVPSNFLEEVPDDVEVYLSDAPSRHPPEAPIQGKGKRVPGENTQRRSASPTVHPHHHHHHHSGSAVIDGPGSPVWARDMPSKKKRGLLSKGKKLLRKLGGVK
ncbi:RIMS-binding protein 2 isoform X2 [Hypanus sabinus]|uniref:RIMS-binding protein 2 isoform X2 n=1 Tax=Hypanus sabinus TaxID=79690 RepID=UPI0028C4B518|nr:RIMS-binding protein 2 isoform X2 [Hypanus sabinus]